eukprot:jgi/Mesvir1/3511/Mv11989-RA.2
MVVPSNPQENEQARPSPDARRRRLVIKEMVLENFKSYAGEQRVGPFHKCFSSVVGPNGSGKSNVIDALLFVFGKRAKQLRLNKVSELIHNSSDFQNLESARVSVHFHEIIDDGLNDEEFEIVPNSDLTVTRAAFRNNTSKYYLNDHASNATEVTTVLKGKGIDLDNNRFLILQGEVEQIAMMKPKGQAPGDEGLLEYLEDIIGSNVYVERIQQREKEVEEVTEKRQGMINRVKIVEKEKERLEGAKLEAENYMAKEMELWSTRGVLAQLMEAACARHITDIEAKRGEAEAKLEHERAKYLDHNAKMAVMEKAMAEKNKEKQAVQAELDICQKDYSEFERKDIKSREDLSHCKAKLKKLKEKLEKDEKKKEEMARASVDAEAAIPATQKRIEASGKQLALEEQQLEKVQAAVREELEGYRVQLEAVQEQLAPWDKKRAEAQARVDVATAERDLLVGKQAAAEQRLRNAVAAESSAKESLVAKERDISRMEAEARDARQAATKARADEKAHAAKEAELAANVQALRSRCAELRAAQSAERSQGAVAKGLMAAKASGQIPGIFGRLGDLGAIDAKYDVAVSTACGALDWIVVATTGDAQKCVELLRKNNLGIATFLILEKQQHLASKMREKVSPPEGVPRLFDLIQVPDERLLPAFYFALKDTVVAAELDQASRIAYGRDPRFKRVVTLDGQLIETSGTMSGGGGKPKGGKMGSRVVADAGKAEADLRATEEQLSAEETRLGEAKAGGLDAGKKAAAAEARIAELEVAIPKTQMEVDALRLTLVTLSQQMKPLQADTVASKEDAARVKELEASLVAMNKELVGILKGSEALRKKAAELQAAMDMATGAKLGQQKAKVAELQESMERDAKEVSRLQVLIASNAKSVAKLVKALEEGTDEKEKLAASIEAKKEEFRLMEEQAFAVLETYKETQAVLEAKEAELGEMGKELNAVKVAVDTIRTVEVDIQNKLDDLLRASKENAEKGRFWSKKLAEARKKMLDCSHEANLGDDIPPLLTEEQLAEQNEDDLNVRTVMLEEALAALKPDMAAIAQYRKKEAEYLERVQELDAVTAQRDALRKEHEELRKKRLDEFMAGFNIITLKLKEMYQMITLGGDAELELVDSLDPFSEGIVFSVRPPKKSWKNICNLSGGEKVRACLSKHAPATGFNFMYLTGSMLSFQP